VADESLHYQTIREVGERLKRREISAVELATAILDRAEKLDGTLNAFITITRETALAQARSADQALAAGHYLGPLHGIPISLKDLYQTSGITTTGGSKILADWVPEADSTVARRLRQAGAVLIGKNNLHEFAYGATNENPHYGPARNPWNVERITGGSSGGSSAAVAAGIGYASMGSDTGGSIRLPAALCGVVGVKPTYGLVSRAGVLPLSWSLDHCGPLTRTVEDTALILNAIVGHDASDPASASRVTPDLCTALDRRMNGLRIGLLTEYMGDNVVPEIKDGVRAALTALQGQGASVEEVSVPEVGHRNGVVAAILYSEASTVHERWLRTRGAEYGADVLERLRHGQRLAATQYLRGQQARRALMERFRTVFTGIDVLATPTVPILAPTLPESRGWAARSQLLGFTQLFNVLGLPAVSVPCGFSRNGLPMGLQLVGRPFEEETILRVAHTYEQQAGWYNNRPAV
jgi:aspartyl-tRNA(Asn)/glutamyl-tRNA(Gln) amidotransferase subunit A